MAMPPPQPGQVINGFRFNGGNPNDQRAWTKADDLAGAESRSRLSMGLSPAVEAHRSMVQQEGAVAPQHKTPLGNDWGAAMLSGIPVVGDNLAKMAGGQDYQNYDTAARSFEAAVMPIMSGSAVTPTEAQRQIRANLPQLGDSPETLQIKARNRAMMLNGAARSMGQPPPFPDQQTFGVNGPAQGGQQRPPQAQPQQGGGIPVYDLSGKRVR